MMPKDIEISEKAKEIGRLVRLRIAINMLADALQEYGVHKPDCLSATAFFDDMGRIADGSHCGCKLFETIVLWRSVADSPKEDTE